MVVKYQARVSNKYLATSVFGQLCVALNDGIELVHQGLYFSRALLCERRVSLLETMPVMIC
eukprot:14030061-Ditylum_brightwellii.AAC.1